MKKQLNKAFWVTNISNKIVSLSDLGLCIYPMRSVNLLDNKHYSLTEEQVTKSAASGSLFIKKTMVVVRKVAPPGQPSMHIPIQEDAIYPTKYRSAVVSENVTYEELAVDDETYAEENAESAEKDHLGKWNK